MLKLFFVFLFVIFLFIITVFFVFKTKEETNSRLCRFKNLLIKISTTLNMILSVVLVIVTVLFIDVKNINIDYSKIKLLYPFGISILLLNILGAIILLYKLNLKNIIECCKDKSIKLFSKIYSHFCVFLLATLIILPILYFLYITNFYGIDPYVAIFKISDNFELLICLLILLTTINVSCYNHFCALKYSPHNTIKNISEDDFKKVKKFSIGAFSLGWIWGLYNESYSLLAIQFFVPIIPVIGHLVANLIMPIIWGCDAYKMALMHKQCNSVEVFLQSKKEYDIVGLIYLIINILLLIFALIIFLFY